MKHASLCFLLLSLAACGAIEVSPAANGVTPGGIQDIDFAREQIALGNVPQAEAISVEGLLSEHDLPTGGEPCNDMLCLRPALAYAPSLETGENEYWLHVGMTSGLDFERPPLDVTIVIDRSSSMSGDMDETNEAAIDILRQLGPNDRASVLAYNERVDVVAPHAPVADLEGLSARIREISAVGGWGMEAALNAALELQQGLGESRERVRRIVVLSCGYPDSASFRPIAQRAAEGRIGFTFVGILLGYDAGLADVLGDTRGGNYFYTSSLESITSLFDDELDFMMTPLTYDLRVDFDLGSSFSVAKAYGVPGEGEEWEDIDIATTFLSSRRGGIVVRLNSESRFDQDLGQINMSYEPEPAHGWDGSVEEQAELRLEETNEVHYGSLGARKAVALTNAAVQMATVCRLFHEGERGAARETIRELSDYLQAESEALNDEGVRRELELVRSLAALIGA